MKTTDPPPVLLESTAQKLRACANADGCGGEVEPGKAMFTDSPHIVGGARRTYCLQCGKVLRYHRKKAAERGDAPVLTFADVRRIHG